MNTGYVLDLTSVFSRIFLFFRDWHQTSLSWFACMPAYHKATECILLCFFIIIHQMACRLESQWACKGQRDGTLERGKLKVRGWLRLISGEYTLARPLNFITRIRLASRSAAHDDGTSGLGCAVVGYPQHSSLVIITESLCQLCIPSISGCT